MPEYALTTMQAQKLTDAQQQFTAAQLVAQQATKAAEAALARRNDIIALVLDAHGAPLTAEVDLARGVVVVPDTPAEQ